ncbi:MAG: preprotein translocase subunit SecE [Oscillospiraceae bacterium]|jgi:preprotein translocase subunit SecE|nr:preprotein translocase subunit SecE [Oscillospiraceae bacterium]
MNETKIAKPTPPKPVRPKVNVKVAVAKWFREMRSELKKVIWPTKEVTAKNSLVAITVMIAAGIVIGAFDQLALLIVRTLINIGG